MNLGWQRFKIGIVGTTFSICALAALIRPTTQRRLPETKPTNLYKVVLEELHALREADYPRAYRQVSLSMQDRYNLDAFAELVRIDHPELPRYERVEFGAIRVQSRHALVPVYFFMHSGEIVSVHYVLVYEEGRWKIDASRVDRRWDQGHRVAGERT
jgi:hypothetical protein